MIVNGIDTKDITVIVQGAVDKLNTPLCLAGIRRNIPDSEIILSTWEGSEATELDCDMVLFNKDPGGVQDKFQKNFVNNTLRQLLSTQNGVERASGKYIMKIRSDLIFRSCAFLKYFECFGSRDERYELFSHRVIFSAFFSKKFVSSPIEDQPVPFHISDWIAFGKSEDIRFLYDIPLPEEPMNSWYLSINKYIGVKTDLLHASHQYAPEQYIFYHACKKNFPNIQFEHYLDYDRANIMISEKIIANNCIILDPKQFKFICGKEKAGGDYYKRWTRYPITWPKLLKRGLYSHEVFLRDYKRYCAERTSDEKENI